MIVILAEEKIEANPQEINNLKRRRSQLAINTANIVDNADQQLYPSVLNQIQTSTGLSLNDLGLIVSIRSLLQAVTTPMWGWWSDRHSRVKVLSLGCFIWGVCTIILGALSTFWGMLFVRALTGIGLAVIIPTTDSLIGNYFPANSRGRAFGLLGLTGVIGVVFGTLFATAIVSSNYIFGIESWRFSFYVMGLISIAIGFLVLFVAKEPQRGLMEGLTEKQQAKYQMKGSDFIKILSNKTFMLIVLQGIAGSIPWNAILLMVTRLEYVGI